MVHIPTARLTIEDGRAGPIPLIVATDWHIGNKYADQPLIDRVIKHADELNAYWWLNGDILNNNTKTSVGHPKEDDLDPNEQIQKALEIWQPRAGKVLGVVKGNHEQRTDRTSDLDTMKLFAELIQAPYLHMHGIVAATFNGAKWVIDGMHGVRGCGRKEGSSVNVIQEMSNLVDADIYIHGHHHAANFTSGRVAKHKDPIGFYYQTRYFVNGGTMQEFGGWPSDQGFPAGRGPGCYVLWLHPNAGKGKTGKFVTAEWLDRRKFGMAV